MVSGETSYFSTTASLEMIFWKAKRTAVVLTVNPACIREREYVRWNFFNGALPTIGETSAYVLIQLVLPRDGETSAETYDTCAVSGKMLPGIVNKPFLIIRIELKQRFVRKRTLVSSTMAVYVRYSFIHFGTFRCHSRWTPPLRIQLPDSCLTLCILNQLRQ